MLGFLVDRDGVNVPRASRPSHTSAAMAVVVQRFVQDGRAGFAFSAPRELRRHDARSATLRGLYEIVSASPARTWSSIACWPPGSRRAETLMTHLMTGLGTLPNTRLTYGLMTLSEVTRAEPRVKAFLSSADDQAMRSYRSKLASTRFLDGFEALLNEFGHRGRFESDVMSVRFGEDPEPSLRMVQLYVRAGALEDPRQHAARRARIQVAAKEEVRAPFGPIGGCSSLGGVPAP
jgi:hypothetical protein